MWLLAGRLAEGARDGYKLASDLSLSGFGDAGFEIPGKHCCVDRTHHPHLCRIQRDL